MANEPLSLSEILARLPEGADFDAVHAAVVATERGRAFLSEYAQRNRHADTRMLVGALERVEAAVRGQPAPPLPTELPQIASEIGRIEAGLAAGSNVDEISAAIERLHDVAFGLHERLLEQSLRDAFDGAVRKLSDALTQPAGIIARRQQAVVQLRALAERLQAAIAPAPGDIRPAAALSDNDHVAIDAQVIAQPKMVEAPLPAAVTMAHDQHATVDEQPAPDQIEADMTADAPLAQQAVAAEPSAPEQFEAEPIISEPSIENVSAIEDADDAADRAGSASEASGDASLSSESVLVGAFEGDAFTRLAESDRSSADPLLPPDVAQGGTAPGSKAASEALLPSQPYAQEIVAGPKEDPDEPFDPMPVPSPLGAAAVIEEPISEPDISLQHDTMAPATRSVPRPAASDALSAVRDLSEEELIALFT